MIGQYTKIIPETAWAIIFLLVFLVITFKSLKELLKSRKNRSGTKEGE